MYKYLFIIVAFVAGAFLFPACSNDDEGSSADENLKKGLEHLAANAKREGVITTMSGLQYEVLTEGAVNGKRPTINDMVRCRYTGMFIDGKVFDTSGSNSIIFPLSGVIAGWTEGLQYMTEGAKFRFVIPYNLAYGPSGYSTIPPYSTLIFEVELIEVM